MEIKESRILFKGNTLEGHEIVHTKRCIEDLSGIFKDEKAWESINPQKLVYEVDCHFPVQEGTSGGLFFGITKIYPGKVGREFFMTKGHFHNQSHSAEYYWGIEGEGVLILMDKNGKTWGEKMHQGSLHYIPAHVAHRVANTGNEVLSFGACWPSDAGHDYKTIAEKGFTARLVEKNGLPIFENNI